MAGTVEDILVEEGQSVEEGQVLARLDTSEWENELRALELQLIAKQRDLLQARINLENAKYALDKAEEETTTSIVGDVVVKASADDWEIAIKELQVELAEARVEDAQRALEEAQEELEEALEKSPEIIAPFYGFITRVNVEGGDEILKGTVAVELADPNKFEADILVSEMDILQVKLGGQAWVEVDAVEGLNLPAEVTHISPTATIQSGVVNYEVKVELQSLETVMQEQQRARQETMPDISSGELPERLKQAIEEGQISQEQAEEMMKQMQQGQGGQERQMSATIPENFQLREGLTVTVSIIVDERNNVVLVPNGTIIIQGGKTYVQVLSPDGTIEERTITTGISDWQYTEVTEGLSEGEQVVVPQGTATTTTTTQQQGPQGGIKIPGMGGRLG
jgi:multidrug efflux pump subunit AcrA (membrane-fusion protein)